MAKRIRNENGLIPAHEVVLRHWMANRDKGEALRAGGYNKIKRAAKNYDTSFSKIFKRPEVQRLYRKLLDEQNERLEGKADKLQKEILDSLYDNALSDLTEFVSWDQHGNITVRPSNELSHKKARCLKKIKQTTREYTNKQGEPIITTTVEVELNDALKAIDMAIRQLDLMPREKDKGMTDEVMEKMATKLEEARARVIQHQHEESERRRQQENSTPGRPHANVVRLGGV